MGWIEDGLGTGDCGQEDTKRRWKWQLFGSAFIIVTGGAICPTISLVMFICEGIPTGWATIERMYYLLDVIVC